MLNGVARVISTFGDSLKDDLFIERVGKVSIKELARTAKDRRAGSLGYAEAIVIFYNKKNHSALHMGKLYNNKSKKNMEPAENRKRPLTETTHSEAAPVPGDADPGASPEQVE